MRTALVAVGGSLAAMPAAALELGDLTVHSTLGQPLRASIAYALGPNEALSDTCVTLQATRNAAGLPSVTKASMIVSNGVIAITGSGVVSEPLLSMRVNIRCPYTAQLTREFMLFVDPAGSLPVAATAARPQTSVRAPARPQTMAPAAKQTRTAVPRRQPGSEPIAAATRYRVQPGDSLSTIAQRIENRPVALWDAVYAMFEANPDAFLDADPNRLKAGSWLTIPSFGADEPLSVAETATAPDAPVEPAAVSTPYEPAAFERAATVQEPAPQAAAPIPEPVAEPVAETDAPLADLRPGDIIVDNDDRFADADLAPIDEAVVIPDTALQEPEVTSDSPNVPVAAIRPATTADEPTTTNWLLWFGGGGVAIIVALLLFGRRFRSRFGSTPIAPAVPQRRKTDTAELEALAVAEDVDAEIDMLIADDSPTEENLALDVDLVVGSGLQEGTDVDLAHDFDFAATTDLDLELPEALPESEEGPETDIIPPVHMEQDSILDNEVMPGDDEYDMSVIVDATQMPAPEDVTKKDLEAVQIDAGDETLITDDYTLSHEVDYKVLEQDYEDEMSATQALNVEIARAAEELASRMDEDLDAVTAESLPLATVHELGVTAQQRGAEAPDIGDDDDTGVNPTIGVDAEDRTAELEADDRTAEMEVGDNDVTVEMEADDTDVTAEMDVGDGKVDTKTG